MPDYYIIERKMDRRVRSLDDLPTRTAATPEDACRDYAKRQGRDGTYIAIDVAACATVLVTEDVQRTFTATRVVE